MSLSLVLLYLSCCRLFRVFKTLVAVLSPSPSSLSTGMSVSGASGSPASSFATCVGLGESFEHTSVAVPKVLRKARSGNNQDHIVHILADFLGWHLSWKNLCHSSDRRRHLLVDDLRFSVAFLRLGLGEGQHRQKSSGVGAPDTADKVATGFWFVGPFCPLGSVPGAA
eukprot:5658078-Amphidinium_carterae.2